MTDVKRLVNVQTACRVCKLEQMRIACPQVMGAHLSALRGHVHEQSMWHEALEMLQRARDLPAGEERLFASLRISYDALEDDQKRMFLDTAFFFLGRRPDTAKHAWKGYEQCPRELLDITS